MSKEPNNLLEEYPDTAVARQILEAEIAEEALQRFRQSDPSQKWAEERRLKSRRQKLVKEFQERVRVQTAENEKALAGSVLFLADQTTYRQYIEKQLVIRGHDVFTAMRLSEFLGILGKSQVDLLVLNLPGSQSFPLAQMLKSKSLSLREKPFILCSDHCRREDLVLGHRLNIKGWFTRPFKTDEFIESVSGEICLARRRNGAVVPARGPARAQQPSLDSIVIPGGRSARVPSR